MSFQELRVLSSLAQVKVVKAESEASNIQSTEF